MRTAVADTGPINYLCLIGEIDVLPKLFAQVLVPPAVWRELNRPQTPTLVAEWIGEPQPWLRVEAPNTILRSLTLHPGETEAISLALEKKSTTLLMDERKGRAAARALGIETTGTLAVLFQAHELGMISFEAAIDRLRMTNFRYDAVLVESLVQRARTHRHD